MSAADRTPDSKRVGFASFPPTVVENEPATETDDASPVGTEPSRPKQPSKEAGEGAALKASAAESDDGTPQRAEGDSPSKPEAASASASSAAPTTAAAATSSPAANVPRIARKCSGRNLHAAALLGGSTTLRSSLKSSSTVDKNGAKVVHCDDCDEDIPAEEWPNHRAGLRTVKMQQETKTFVQKYILTPILSTLIWMLVNVFFREVAVVGKQRVPRTGAVVFYGNHQNQFIDAMMMRAFCGRPVRFIIAEKSMSRPIIGSFARLMDSVPVIRPQDVPSVAGQGKLVKTEGSTITGQGTNFTTALHQGDVIIWSSPDRAERCSGQVQSITSDTLVVLTRPVPDDAHIASAVNWKLSKRIDHSEMYAEVYNTLKAGGAIGIFPEGGSHDHTSLIPLKAGVALFTLGAAERGVDAAVIPVGLTYFYGHKFRSRAHIEFGEPMTPPAELVKQFEHDKRNATGDLLKILDRNLRNVTINVNDWATLKFLHNFRRVYQPDGLLLNTGDYLSLTRRLAEIIQKHGDEPDLQDFREKAENYSDFCAALFVRDSQAVTLSALVDSQGQLSFSIRILLRRIAMLMVLTFVLIPFFVVCGPIGLLCHFLAEAHARTALSASSVKIVAADVKASHKMVLGFCLVPLVFGVVSGYVAWVNDARTGFTVLISMPVVMYVSVVLVREWILELFATLPLVMSIVSKHKQFMKLHDRRCALVEQAKVIVDKYDPALTEKLRQFTTAAAGTGAVTRQASLFSLRHQSRVVERSSSQKKRL